MNLKQFRKDRGLGQKDIAEIFGCKQNHVSAIESGTRALTPLHIRLLIEKYGFDVVAQYANAAELPEKPSVTINAPVITDNNAPVQAGNGNSMELPPDAGIIEVLRQQSNQINTLLSQQQTMLAHQERLIALLEKK